MYSDYNNQPPVVINDRSSEGLADANIKLGNLKCTVTDLEIKLEAMYRVLLEKGIDPKLFEAKIEEVMKERAESPVKLVQRENQTKNCPKCGRAVKKNANTPLLGKCMYCGTNVPFAPSFGNREGG